MEAPSSPSVARAANLAAVVDRTSTVSPMMGIFLACVEKTIMFGQQKEGVRGMR